MVSERMPSTTPETLRQPRRVAAAILYSHLARLGQTDKLRLAPWPLPQNFMAPVGRHFFPFSAFDSRAQTAKAQSRSAIELAELDARRPITHELALD
jgi:hypothetical protein